MRAFSLHWKSEDGKPWFQNMNNIKLWDYSTMWLDKSQMMSGSLQKFKKVFATDSCSS